MGAKDSRDEPVFTRASGPRRSDTASSGDGSTRRRGPRRIRRGAEEICETPPVNIPDTIDGARRAFEIAGRGCLVRMGEDEPRHATVAEIAARLAPHREAAILLEVASGYQVLILSPEGYDYVGGLTFEGYGLLGASRL